MLFKQKILISSLFYLTYNDTKNAEDEMCMGKFKLLAFKTS
jgi:hypothetical protein